MSVDLVLTDSPEPEARETILRGLDGFSLQHDQPVSSARPLAILLREPDTGIIGGLWGRTDWGWLSLELLFVPEQLRGTGLGARLVRQAEDEAIRRGCRGALVNTFSFQAPGFYERLGYRVFAVLEDCPPGHRRISLQKPLTSASEAAAAAPNTR